MHLFQSVHVRLSLTQKYEMRRAETYRKSAHIDEDDDDDDNQLHKNQKKKIMKKKKIPPQKIK